MRNVKFKKLLKGHSVASWP